MVANKSIVGETWRNMNIMRPGATNKWMVILLANTEHEVISNRVLRVLRDTTVVKSVLMTEIRFAVRENLCFDCHWRVETLRSCRLFNFLLRTVVTKQRDCPWWSSQGLVIWWWQRTWLDVNGSWCCFVIAGWGMICGLSILLCELPTCSQEIVLWKRVYRNKYALVSLTY
jgi:hypothetical protein